MPVLTVFCVVVPFVPFRACDATSVPPTVLPIFSVTSPAVPVHTFFNSIVPCLRVLVNVQMMSSPFASVTLPEVWLFGETVNELPPTRVTQAKIDV